MSVFLSGSGPGIPERIDRTGIEPMEETSSLLTISAERIRDRFRDTLGYLIIVSSSISYESFRKRYGITKKEWEITGLLCEGMEYKKISDKLFISAHTVRNHVHNMSMKKQV